MLKAVMVKDDYSDIAIGFAYDIDRIFSDGHIRLKNSQRIYVHTSFHFYNDSKKITYSEAYRLQQLDVVKRKLGIL